MVSLTRQQENELVVRAKAGDTAALNELLMSCQSRLYASLVRFLDGNDADAKDVMQKTMIRVMRKIHLFRGDCAFFSWVYRVAINLAKTHILLNRSGPTLIGGDPWDWPSDPEGLSSGCGGSSDSVNDHHAMGDYFVIDRDPSDEIAATELDKQINDEVMNLPPRARQLFMLKEFGLMSCSEISEMLDIDLVIVHRDLRNSRRSLAEKIPELKQLRRFSKKVRKK